MIESTDYYRVEVVIRRHREARYRKSIFVNLASKEDAELVAVNMRNIGYTAHVMHYRTPDVRTFSEALAYIEQGIGVAA